MPFRKVYVLGNDLDIVWWSGYYDGPTDGLCNYNGFLARFEWCDDDEDTQERLYEVSVLSLRDEIKWTVIKWLFELFVGKHCTAPAYHTNRNWAKQPWKSLSEFYYKFLSRH